MSLPARVVAGLGFADGAGKLPNRADGKLRANPLFGFHDLLVLQLDGDVAKIHMRREYTRSVSRAYITLRTAFAPPASATVNRFREVVLRWMGRKNNAAKNSFLHTIQIPSKMLLVGLFPEDSMANRPDIDVVANPAAVLQGKPKNVGFVRSGRKRCR